MTAKHIQRGIDGEDRASEFLVQHGFSILHRNIKRSRVEIDILAREHKELVFVEVKTRDNNSYGFPELAVGKKKMEHLAKAAEIICEELKHQGEIRFDIISITLTNPIEIHHIRDAFFPGL